MCIIVMKPADKTLTEERIDAMWKRNSDGAGFMYAEDGALRIVKGLMTLDAFKTALAAVGQDRKLVIHFRIRTHGAIKPEMTHPFWVTGNLGMAHNGTISKVTATQLRSDSSVFAEMLSREYSDPLIAIQNKFHREMIEAYIGSYNKLVFMDATGQHYILNESAGTWEDGVWYSNTTFRNYGSTTYYSSGSGYSGNYGTYGGWSGSSSAHVTTKEEDEELERWINARATVIRERTGDTQEAKAAPSTTTTTTTASTPSTLPPPPVKTESRQMELVKYTGPGGSTSNGNGNVVMHNAPIIKKIMGPDGRMKEVKTYPAQTQASGRLPQLSTRENDKN